MVPKRRCIPRLNEKGNDHFGRWRFDGRDPGLRQAARANWPHHPLAPGFLHSLGRSSAQTHGAPWIGCIAHRKVGCFSPCDLCIISRLKFNRSRRQNYEQARWRYPVSGTSPVRVCRVSSHRDRRPREGRRRLSRHAQRAERLLRGAGLRLSHWLPRRLPRRDPAQAWCTVSRVSPMPRRSPAHDLDRRCLGDSSERHGRVPGRAGRRPIASPFGGPRAASTGARSASPSSGWQPATRSMVAPAPPISTCPMHIKGKCDLDKVVEVERVPIGERRNGSCVL